jgi:raffinose/stachyose/melibiose transport system substrate-binding protein
VPVSTNVLGVLYNRAVFARLGLTVPSTFAQFEETCQRLKDAGVVPMAGGFRDSWTTQIIPFIAIAQYVQSRHDRPREALDLLAAGRLGFDTPAFRRALELQNRWAERGFFQDRYMGTDVNVASAMVGSGAAAMLVNGSWQCKAVQEASGGVPIGFFPLPLNESPAEPLLVPTGATGGICISSTCGSAAGRALSYYLGAEMQRLVIADVKGIPTHQGVSVQDPFLEEVTAALRTARPTGLWYGMTTPQTVNDLLEKGFQAMLAGVQGVEELRRQADSAMAEALAAGRAGP